MSEGLITVADQTKRLQKLLDERTTQIAAALPSNTLSPERFARVVLTLCARNTDLMTKCNPASLIRAVMEAAQLGLAPDPVLGHAWFVPFKGIVQMIPGYKGLVHLAWQSDRISKVVARPVYDGDDFEVEYGLQERLIHRPRHKTDKLTNVYSFVQIKGGDPMFHAMTIDEVIAVKKRSPAGNRGPWVTDFDAMALKSTLRRLCKLTPMSTTDMRMAQALHLDEAAEHGLRQHLQVGDGFMGEEAETPMDDEEKALAEAARAAEQR